MSTESKPATAASDMSSVTTRHTTGKPPSGPGSDRITSLWRQAMSSKQKRFRVAILDDYQNVALSLADWSVLDGRATVTVFNDHLADADAVIERLQPFEIVGVRSRITQPISNGCRRSMTASASARWSLNTVTV